MNAPQIHFLPYSRRGVGASTGLGIGNGRRLVSLQLQLAVVPTPTADSAAPEPAPIDVVSAPLAVMGPGDVRGITDNQVIRRIPRAGDDSMEPGYLAGIEFAHPDLPWMFALGPHHNGTVQPWLMLVVLPADHEIRYLPASHCPVLTLPNAECVPPPSNAWAYAHVQVYGAADGPQAQAWATAPESHAAALRSRLLCPTRLAPETEYIAAVVPTYETGRLAGLGLDPLGETNGDKPWVPAAGLQLPVYESWTFSTGPMGDFEELAERLHGAGPEVMAQLGTRAVVIEPRGSMLPPEAFPDGFGGFAAPGVFEVPTAIIRVNDFGSTGGAGPLAPDFTGDGGRAVVLHAMLKHLLDPVAQADDEDPIVGPPLYGQWPARINDIDGQPLSPALADVDGDADSRQGWIEQLNADPFHRIAAGLGAAIVRRDQEELMRDAWEQLAELDRANHRIRWSALHMAAATSIHRRIAAADTASQLRFLSPALSRLRSGTGESFYGRINASVVPPEVLTTAFTHQSRSARQAVRRATAAPGNPAEAAAVPAPGAVAAAAMDIMQNRPELFQPGPFTAKALSKDVLEDLAHESRFADRVQSVLGMDGGAYLQRINELPDLLGKLASVAVTSGAADSVVHGQEEGPTSAVSKMRVDAGLLENIVKVDLSTLTVAQSGELQSPQILSQRLRVNADRLTLGAGLAASAIRAVSAVSAGGTERPEVINTSVAALRDAASDLLGTKKLQGAWLEAATQGDNGGKLVEGLVHDSALVTPVGTATEFPTAQAWTEAAGQQLIQAVEPAAAYCRMLAWAAEFDVGQVSRRPDYAYSPAMAAPCFPEPAVERLRNIDEKWILGGAEELPPDSVCLMEINWKFVESLLAGANHEIAREMVWRHYPTDLRGSSFRRFWEGAADDIAPMDSWRGPLGMHQFQGPDAAAGPRADVTLLLIKGSLLRRYPNTLITAVQGVEGPNDTFSPTGAACSELFRGRLCPDVSYVGLSITPDTLKVVGPGDPPARWYIQLLEPPSEPRFALDEVPSAEPGRVLHISPEESVSENATLPGHSAIAAQRLHKKPFRLLMLGTDYI